MKLSDVEETVGQGIKSTPSLFLLLVGTGNYRLSTCWLPRKEERGHLCLCGEFENE